MKHFLVIGLGRFGRAAAEELALGGGDVMAVDRQMPLVEAVRDRVAVAAQVDDLEPDTLRTLGVREVDAAIVAIGEDFAAKTLAVAILRELGVKEIVARANSDRERRLLELVGATRVVAIESEMGQRVARALLATDVLDHVPLDAGVSIAFWTADDRVLGKRLDETELRARWQLNVIGVRHAGGVLDILPAPDYVFQSGDVLLLAGANTRLAQFTK